MNCLALLANRSRAPLVGAFVLAVALVHGRASAGDRPDIWSFTPVQRADLFTQMSNYITKTTIEDHRCPPGDKHNSARFLVWHRAYIKKMEDYLIAQNRPQFVPLPKWAPSTCIPPEFLVGGGVDIHCALVAACFANAANCVALVNSCPNVPILASLSTNLCSQTVFNTFRSTLEGSYHNGVHGAVGGVMGTYESPGAPIFWLWHAHVDDVWYDWQCSCGLDEGGAFSSYTPEEIITDLRAGIADGWIRDSDADIAKEPNTETGVVLWESKDIWVRNAPATPVGTGRYLNEHQHQNPEYAVIPANRPYIYVKLRNRGCLPISGNLRVYWANASTGLLWPTNFTEVSTSPVAVTTLGAGREFVGQFHWLDIPMPGGSAGSHFCLVARFVASPTSADPINGESNGVGVSQNVKNSNQIAWKNLTIVDNVANLVPFLIRNISLRSNFLQLRFSIPDEQRGDSFFDHAGVAIDLGPTLFQRWQQNGGRGTGIRVDPRGFVQVLAPDATIDGLPLAFREEFLVQLQFAAGADPCEDGTRVFDLRVSASDGQEVLGGNTYAYAPRGSLSSPDLTIAALDPTTDCRGGRVRLQLMTQVPAGTTLQWYGDGTPIPNATGGLYVASSSGEYAVQATYPNGCRRFSQPINVHVGLPPANDDPCRALALVANQPIPFETYCATADPLEPSPGVGTGANEGCQSRDGWCRRDPRVDGSLWYRLRAPASGVVSLHVMTDHDHMTNTQLAVWRAPNCADYGGYRLVAANDDGGEHGVFGTDPALPNLRLSPGAEYLVQLDGYLGSRGRGLLMLEDPCSGSFATYGMGSRGSGGFVPDLTGRGCPNAGQTFALEIASGVGGAPGLLVFGTIQIAIPFLGGFLYTQPLIDLPIQLAGNPGVPGAGTLSLPIVTPNDPNLAGATVYAQAFLLDLGVPVAITSTNGLATTF